MYTMYSYTLVNVAFLSIEQSYGCLIASEATLPKLFKADQLQTVNIQALVRSAFIKW